VGATIQNTPRFIPAHRSDSESHEIWNQVINGDHPDALLVTIMSKESFKDIELALRNNPEQRRPFRVLTLDPAMNKHAIEAFGRHLSEHKSAPSEAIPQVRNAAIRWAALAKRFPGRMVVKTYNSAPTLHGILVENDVVLVELIPYDTPKGSRPAVLIRRADDKDNFDLFANAFKRLWENGKDIVAPVEVDDNTLYTQAYTELRRYRDYELTAATWFTALQIGLGVALSANTSTYQFVLKHNPALTQYVVGGVIWVLGAAGVSAVSYAKARYEQLRKAMECRFGAFYTWPTLPRGRLGWFISPFSWIVFAMTMITAGQMFLVAKAFGWSDTEMRLALEAVLVVVPLLWVARRYWRSPATRR
jgi:hypothetical protein